MCEGGNGRERQKEGNSELLNVKANYNKEDHAEGRAN